MFRFLLRTGGVLVNLVLAREIFKIESEKRNFLDNLPDQEAEKLRLRYRFICSFYPIYGAHPLINYSIDNKIRYDEEIKKKYSSFFPNIQPKSDDLSGLNRWRSYKP